MMNKPPLYGRRIHIAGSIPEDLTVAKTETVEKARAFIRSLVIELLKKGATFVIPLDSEKKREDGFPICFDWLILDTISKNIVKCPPASTNPLIYAIQHHKTEEQIPEEFEELWDNLKCSDHVAIDNASHWNMASKRMEVAATHGDILITLGGSEGVLFLANLYHQSGKSVMPLNLDLCPADQGSKRLFSQALIRTQSSRFFKCNSTVPAHSWINRINFVKRHDLKHMVEETMSLLEAIQRPTVFAVRLLDQDNTDFLEVENYFSAVIQPVIENQLGYILKIIDGKQRNESPTIDAEIFTKLHHSSVVVADLTGSRPNCFIELGYALARSIPVMMTARKGTKFPFDVTTLPGHPWDNSLTIPEQKRLFLEYWNANFYRPSLVQEEPLIP